eukprot:g4195.t1
MAWVPGVLILCVLPRLPTAVFGSLVTLLALALFILSGCAPRPLAAAFSRTVHRLKGGGRPRRRPFELSELAGGALLIGCQPQSEADVRSLAKRGVTALVSLNQEWELHVPSASGVFSDSGIKRLHLPLPDYQGPTQAELRTAVLFVRTALRAGGKAYVHCNAGRGRAAVTAGAVLLAEKIGRCRTDCTAAAAYAELREARPSVSGSLVRTISPQGRALRAWAASVCARRPLAAGVPADRVPLRLHSSTRQFPKCETQRKH